MAIVGQNALLNQYMPTFYIKDIRDGQTLRYDSVRKAFINAEGSGGTGATRLGELLDVSPTVDNPLSLAAGQALVYDPISGLWTNKFVDYNTLLNKPVIPTNGSFSFAGLSDTAKPALPDGYVKWNSDGTQLIYSTTIPAESITGLAQVAITGDYNDLTNLPPVSSWKQYAKAFANVDIPLSFPGTLVIDDIEIQNGDRVVLSAQLAADDNGIYSATILNDSYMLVRSSDSDEPTELNGAVIYVQDGTNYASTIWVQSGLVGVDFVGQAWTQFSGSAVYTAGSAISINSSDQISITTDGITTYVDSGNNLAVKSSSTAGQVLKSVGSGTAQWGALDISNSASVTGTLSIANGGTGATTAQAAINALLPTQSSSAGMFLTTDGSDVSWQTVPGGGASAPQHQIVFGDASGEGITSTDAFTYNTTTNSFYVNVPTVESDTAEVIIRTGDNSTGSGHADFLMTSSSGTRSSEIYLQGGNNNGTAAGGHVTISAGNSSAGRGGEMTVSAGNGDRSGGSVTISAGNGNTDYAGEISLSAGSTNSATDSGGSVYITAGQNNVDSTLNGSVIISAGGQNRFTIFSTGALGVSSSTGTAGQVLTSAGPDAPAVWSDVSGTGTVTSVDVSGGTTGLTTTGGPITSSGTITLGGTLSTANGGTGATTAQAAFNNLAPSQTGNAGKVLSTDGTNATWITVSSGGGSVTSVSASGSQGVTALVLNATTTPEIQIGLGNITPTSVASTGTVTGSNLSGTNTGDQTITLTGDMTGSGTGTFATTLATVNSSPQTNAFRKITVNAKGLVIDTSAVGSSDITTALGYTPYNATNPDGYITGITGTDVIDALGYTPYDASNPNGYTNNTGTVTSVNASGGTTGLSFTGGPITDSGTLTLSGTLSIANGGTGATTAADAINALVPSQATKNGMFLTTDGSVVAWAPIPSGSGSVTAVSGSGLNGMIVTVTNATTTPNIEVDLGNITPTSVAATGTVSGSNLSGTNTGDQTIELTGDVTGSGTGTFVATLATVNTTSGTYGDSHFVPTINVNGKGLVTSITVQHVDTTVRDLVEEVDTIVIDARHQYIVTGTMEILGRMENNGRIAIL